MKDDKEDQEEMSNESIAKFCFDSAFVGFSTFEQILKKTKSERTEEQEEYLEEMVSELRGLLIKIDAFFEDGKMIRTDQDWRDDDAESYDRN